MAILAWASFAFFNEWYMFAVLTVSHKPAHEPVNIGEMLFFSAINVQNDIASHASSIELAWLALLLQ